MKTQKTIRLPGEYYWITPSGVLMFVRWDDHGKGELESRRSSLQVGTRRTLVSAEDVSPNAMRGYGERTRWHLVEGPVGGNSNSNIRRYHGWRGTSNDWSTTAHGERKVLRIRTLKCGDVAVTFGPDLRPDDD